jgi:hypothetical protein
MIANGSNEQVPPQWFNIEGFNAKCREMYKVLKECFEKMPK